MVTRQRARLISEARLPYLSHGERQTLACFLERLEDAAADRVQHVIFFGSKARGDTEPYSDLDVMVVADVGEDELRTLAADLETNDGVPLMPQLWSSEEYERQHYLKMPFYVNIRRDGVELWDEIRWQEERRAVHQFLIKPGYLEPEYGQVYDDLLEARVFSDYIQPDKPPSFTEDQLRQFPAEARRFVARIERFLKEHGFEPPADDK